MSDSEDFLSRWLRLKRESEVALANRDERSPPAFDPACLPSIESIVADSDIRQYLHANVPPELTRAALRCAWAADPAIRGFIGIAESQWDFNDHAAMPGFGPLQATDYLVAQALGSLNHDAPGAPEYPGTAEEPALPTPEVQCIEPVQEIRQVAAVPRHGSQDPEHDGHVGETMGSEAGLGPRAPRSHGGALPR